MPYWKEGIDFVKIFDFHLSWPQGPQVGFKEICSIDCHTNSTVILNEILNVLFVWYKMECTRGNHTNLGICLN